MSLLEKFQAKPKKIKLGDEEIEIYPLSGRDIDLFVKMGDEKLRPKAIIEILVRTLKKSIPDVTEEEILNMDIKYITEILKAVMGVNTVETDVQKIFKR